MTGLSLMEGAVESVRAWCADNLETYVEAVNEHYQREPFQIVAPTVFALSEQTVSPEPPAILMMGRATFPGDVDESAALETWQDIEVIIVESHPEQDILRQSLYRHTAALVRCLRAGERAGAFHFVWNSPMIRYDPIYRDEDDILWSDAQVLIRVLTEEMDV